MFAHASNSNTKTQNKYIQNMVGGGGRGGGGYILDHVVSCASASSSGRSLHLITKPTENEVKFVELSKHMFGELKVQVRNKLQFVEPSEVCSANKQFALPSGVA